MTDIDTANAAMTQRKQEEDGENDSEEEQSSKCVHHSMTLAC
jgi:hypothetical protein